ncbi:hypothetical protein LY28_02417 [Ruminiclostridium sufflavum DSM 19573]|uniref:Calcineurin-like phosphoesterase domain-containing protein n=1 Tax=Ruminiclostridium sufflavum DSM 19573 TaxID=1121337 RepID=A0A318XJ44_9FIRM|nr:metallophosphoesterase [Ruminiclostridium sufflavum]PYG87034.1 hypothetical protein LY28_02417 [Ruminiclostridium sufflavum DSM 19573]
MKKKRKYLIIICTGLLVIILICAFYNGLVVNKFNITAEKLNENEAIRLVLISDLHSHIYGKNQSKLVKLIERQKPDIIALAGDIADDEEAFEGTELFLAGIKGMAPAYYVTGNHEFWSEDVKDIKDKIKKYDVNILENTFERIRIKNSDIIVCGIEDPEVVKYEKPDMNYYEELQRLFSQMQDKQGYKILLAHRPELIEIYKKYSFDLVLSGHAHGGQIRIPFILNGLFAPNQGWFPEYAGGAYEYKSLTHIVSRGLSYNPRLPRIFNPPEVVVIDLEGKNKVVK